MNIVQKTLSLPLIATLSMIPQIVKAEEPPKYGEISFKHLSYQDGQLRSNNQEGLKRITVQAPSIGIILPTENYSFSLDAVKDEVSGATPRWHTNTTWATPAPGMHDVRNEIGLGMTRYFSRGTFSGSFNNSKENDYWSRAVGLSATKSSEDNNTTLNIGIGYTYDIINSSNQAVINEHKTSKDFVMGLTQNLTPRDIVQISASYSRGNGYYSDPYKYVDNRPREKIQNTVGIKWNHYLKEQQAALKINYRFYKDSFGIVSHTIGADYVKSYGGLKITPSIRYYTQNSATFYVDPDATDTPAFGAVGYISGDQRLAAWGSVNLGLKLDYDITQKLSITWKGEYYRQQSGLRFIGTSSPGLAPFYAKVMQIGLNYKF